MAYRRPIAATPHESMLCTKCGKTLKNIDIGLHKKMINRGADRFMCIDCLGEYIGLTPDELLRKVEQFKAQGCSLFL